MWVVIVIWADVNGDEPEIRGPFEDRAEAQLDADELLQELEESDNVDGAVYVLNLDAPGTEKCSSRGPVHIRSDRPKPTRRGRSTWVTSMC